MKQQLEKLYEYQVLDLELGEKEQKFKETDTRKKLIARQKYFNNANKLVKHIENDIIVRQNTIIEVEAAIEKLISEQESISQKLEALEKKRSESSLDDVKELFRELDTVIDSVAKNKKMVLDNKKASQKADENLKSVLPQMAKVKKEFDALKIEYAKEMEEGSPEIKKLSKKLETMEKEIDGAALKRYKFIKKTLKDPVALLEDGKCSGCNMQLPSSNISSIKSGGKVFECDNCGRIIIMK